jgi:hypothetical protein
MHVLPSGADHFIRAVTTAWRVEGGRRGGRERRGRGRRQERERRGEGGEEEVAATFALRLLRSV